ncbi:hypothetical protein [Streptomyces sp. NPDC055990]|uniref:hypothetical protein n=1 Tax=Streptomyces sp. NPDC055990 TaxID=3345672 RepID=UPI0035E16612
MPDHKQYAAELADLLKQLGDRESSFQPRRDTYWFPIAEQLLAAGVRPPRRIAGPNHGCAPGYGRTVTPAEGYFVGFISELPDDSDGEQLMEFSGTVFPTEAEGRAELVEANEWRPKWHLYRMTDITEGDDRA